MRIQSDLERVFVNENNIIVSFLGGTMSSTGLQDNGDVPLHNHRKFENTKRLAHKENGEPLKTKRKCARYGSRVVVAGNPMMVVKQGNKEDYLTPEEFLQDMYQKTVKAIVFEDGEII